MSVAGLLMLTVVEWYRVQAGWRRERCYMCNGTGIRQTTAAARTSMGRRNATRAMVTACTTHVRHDEPDAGIKLSRISSGRCRARRGETLVSTALRKIVRDLPEPAMLTGGLRYSAPCGVATSPKNPCGSKQPRRVGCQHKALIRLDWRPPCRVPNSGRGFMWGARL